MLIGANVAVAAVPALFLEQSTSITGVSDTLKASRVPVRPATGSIKYYNIEFKFQVDATGAPVLAPLSPVVGLSPALLSGAFKAGNYKSTEGYVYTVTGPGASAGGRTNWSFVLAKPPADCAACRSQGSWTTGPIVGHPLQGTLNAQGITSTIYSWGKIVANNGRFTLNACSPTRAVGFVQIGNQLVLHGFCEINNVETTQLTLNLCTVANPCP